MAVENQLRNSLTQPLPSKILFRVRGATNHEKIAGTISLRASTKAPLHCPTQHPSQNQTFSIITLGDAIVTANPYANKAALGGLQAVFFTLTLALPLVWAALLLLLWLAPLRPQQTRRLYRWCEVAQAWACLDVFILTTIVSLIELDQFSRFILGDECDGINKILDEYFSDLVDGDTVCFGTRSTLLRGCWILFTASLFQHAAGWFVIHAATVALDDEPSITAEPAFGAMTLTLFTLAAGAAASPLLSFATSPAGVLVLSRLLMLSGIAFVLAGLYLTLVPPPRPAKGA